MLHRFEIGCFSRKSRERERDSNLSSISDLHMKCPLFRESFFFTHRFLGQFDFFVTTILWDLFCPEFITVFVAFTIASGQLCKLNVRFYYLSRYSKILLLNDRSTKLNQPSRRRFSDSSHESSIAYVLCIVTRSCQRPPLLILSNSRRSTTTSVLNKHCKRAQEENATRRRR